MAEFDITTHSRKVLQMKKIHDEQIDLLNQKLAKEVAQLHAEIPPEHMDNFVQKGSKGKTGLVYPIARSGLAEPDWYQDVLKVLDRATTNPNITFKDLVTLTGVKQPGNLLKHLITGITSKQFGGEKVITTGRYQPGIDYKIDSYTGVFSPLPMLGMPMYYKGKQIHLFPDLEAKFPEYNKRKITKAFKNQYKPLESVDHMKQLIQLVESAQQEQLDEGVKEKILSLGLAASIFSGSVTATDIKQDMDRMASIAVTPYLMDPQKINKVQQTPEFEIFAKSLHMLGPRETQMLEKYHRASEMMFIVKSTQARADSSDIRKFDKEIEVGVPGSKLDSKKEIRTTYRETNPASVLQTVRDYITGQGPEYSNLNFKDFVGTLTAEQQELLDDMKQRQKIYKLAKKDKIYVAAVVEMYIYLKQTAPDHIIFTRTAQDVLDDEKRFQEFMKSGEGF